MSHTEKSYECPVCEEELFDPGSLDAVVVCTDCGARLRIDYDADGDSEGWRDLTAFYVIEPDAAAREGE